MTLHLTEPEWFTNWLSIDPPYECSPENYPFNLIHAHLRDELSLSQLLAQLTGPIDTQYTDNEVSDFHAGVCFILDTFNFLVPQVDYTHIAQPKLVLLITSLMKLKIGGLQNRSEGGGAKQVVDSNSPWAKPLADWRFNYKVWAPAADNARDEDDEGPEADTIRREWTNCNAFVAQLVSQYGFHEYDHYALYAMRWALEESQITAHELGMEIPATVAWVSVAGEWMWKSQRLWEGQWNAGRGGDLWKGKRGFCAERWEFWKDRFEWVSGREDLREDTRLAASKAAERMRDVAK